MKKGQKDNSVKGRFYAYVVQQINTFEYIIETCLTICLSFILLL